MTNDRFRWPRVMLAVVVAEVLPIVLLILIVVIYAFISDSNHPNSAPRAGNWVGPIGGFAATFCLAWWAARVEPTRGSSYGIAVGVGAACLDFGLALSMGGGAMLGLLLLSNGGRMLAGFLGGLVVQKRHSATSASHGI